MKKILSILVGVMLFLCASAQQTYTFAHRDTLELKLDIYQPANPRPDHACVLYVFGGGFFSGARDNEHSVAACKAYADRGFVVASIDYRLYLAHAPKVPLLKMYTLFDTAIRYSVEDCSAAISYLCSHSAELGIDPARIVLTGSSAGAIAVLQTDYARANNLPSAAALPVGFKPAAVIPYSGAIMCRNNALRYATPPAPTCFFHGTDDRLVNYRRFRGSLHVSLFGANNVAKVFDKNDYSYWICRYPGLGHEISIAQTYTVDEFCAFVDASLSGRHMRYDAVCYDSAIPKSKWGTISVFGLYLGK